MKTGDLIKGVWGLALLAPRAFCRTAFYEVPTLDRFGLYLPACVVLLFYGWWAIFPILPGHAIAALALVAVVMTVRADKFSAAERVIWVLIGAVLMIGESRAIYNDHAKHDAEQKAQSDLHQQQFEATARGLRDAITLSRNNFNTTMDKYSAAQRQEHSEFAGVLSKEQALYEHEEALADSAPAVLTPGNLPTPHNVCGKVDSNSVMAFYGKTGTNPNVAVIQNFPHTIVESRSNGPLLSILKASDGSLRFLIDIRSADKKIVARLDEDGFVINRNNTLEVKKREHSLKVLDLYGNDIFSLNYMNPKAIQD